MSKPFNYIEACLPQVTAWFGFWGFFYTLHKFHLHKLCRPCSSQRPAKNALSPGVKILCDRLGPGQER